jgi:hypothetical protein
MAYSKAQLKSNGDKASPYFQPSFIEDMSEKKKAVIQCSDFTLSHDCNIQKT